MRLLTFFLLIGWGLSTVWGQVEGKVLPIPTKYKEAPTVDITYTPSDQVMRGTLWQVYSDRNYNRTYTSPGGGTALKTLEFLESCYVIEEQGNFIHLVKDPDVSFRGKLSAQAEDYGWIAKKNMLIWQHCMVTKLGKIDRKAMVLNTVQALKNDFEGMHEEMREKRIYFYQDSRLKQKTGRNTQLFQIFYVYKMERGAVLLGRNSRISDAQYIDQDIMGWVDESKVTFWDHRVAIEPNWESPAATARKAAKTKAAVFAGATDARTYKAGGAVPARQVYWNADPYQERFIGDWRRFPILEHREGILKVGIMGQVTAGLTGFSQAENAEIQRKNAQVRQARRNVNVVFVVDGTNSMQRYFPPISKAIRSSMSSLQARYSKNKMRFSAVVYRDAAEGKRALESTRLTSDYNKVAEFVANVDPRDLYDTDKPEAMYMGLEAALRGVGMQKGQTNILILVGDAGNHYRDDRTQVKVEPLIKQIHDFAVSFVAFQVQHGPDKTYDDFISQTRHLMLSSARQTYREQIRQASSLGLKVKPPHFSPVTTGLERLDQGATMGALLVAQQGEGLPILRFQREIERVVEGANAHTDQLLDITDQIVTTGGSAERIISENKKDTTAFVSDYTPAVLDYLLDLNITPQQLQLICQENYQFYMEGYTSFFVDGKSDPYFKSVLFMTRSELADMVNAFDELIDAVRAGEQREKMQEVWIELLRSHLGDIDRVELLEMSMEEINDRVFGLPKASDFLSKIKLKHIADKAILPADEFQTYVVRIRDKRDELKRIFNSTYPYSFQSNDKTYYWIDEDALP